MVDARTKTYCAMLTTGVCDLPARIAALEAENNQLCRQILDAWNAFGPPATRSDPPVFTLNDIADLPQMAEGGIDEQIIELEDSIAALEAQLAERVKVKALEWEDSGFVPDKAWGDACLKQARGHHHLGRYAGSYTIQEIEPGGWWGWWNTWTSDRDPEGVGRTKDEAKAAAQADYESRILSALEATPRATHANSASVEATPRAPKVTEEMVEAASREYMRIFDKHLLSEHARLILTAAQEAGKP
jgi:hypothetical protein